MRCWSSVRNNHRPASVIRRQLALACLCLLALVTVSAQADQRSDFLAAEHALKSGDRARFAALATTLLDYPLYPYLRFAELTEFPETATDEAIALFIADEPDSLLAGRLRRSSLQQFAKAGRWADYARLYYPDESVERRCLFLRALIETGRGDEAMPQIEPLWLVGHKQPDACDPVFTAWQQAGGLTISLVWQRIRLAMEAGQPALVRTLGTLLPDNEQVWQQRWLAVEQTPALVLESSQFATDHPLRAAILAHGITRLAKHTPDQAASALTRLTEWLAVDQAASDRAHAAVGRALTRRGDRQGLVYWDRVLAAADNLSEQEARVRAAIDLNAWEWLAKWIAVMPDCAEKRDRWLYWQARAEEQLGRLDAAQATFIEAANHRSFWGFMAADRVDQPYHLAHTPTPAEPARIRRLVLSPPYRRIQEFRRLNREIDVRREWRTLIQHLVPADLMAAAYIADVLGWHDQAIFTLARTGYWDDLDLRFPLRYRELVAAQAQQTGLAPDWIFAVMRQESVFSPTVASSAGAIGLMQLMPKTAAEVAAELGLNAPSRWDLLDPALNITLGSAYLARMSDRFGHPALATAAYNAGPSRVLRWRPDTDTAADLWIARIPFTETRGYVERVLAYRVIYANRLGLDALRLRDLLPPVPGRAAPPARDNG